MRKSLGSTLAIGLVIITILTNSAPHLGGAKSATSTPSDPQIRTPRASQPVAMATAPGWTFAVYDFIDPYPATDFPTGFVVQPNARYVAAFVEITNPPLSTQQLQLSVNYSVRLVDTSGGGYNAGIIFGAEPRLNDRLLLPGERAHGWVWWQVPQEVKLSMIVFFPPAPEFRVALPLNTAP